MQNCLLWQVLSEPISELVPPAEGSVFGFHMCSEKLVGYKGNTDIFNDKSQNSINNSLGSRCIEVAVFYSTPFQMYCSTLPQYIGTQQE